MLLNAAPPPDHKRRCGARLKRKGGEQCKRWALKGLGYCQLHGGRQAVVNTTHKGRRRNFYSAHLGGTLRDLVEELAKQSAISKLTLTDEVDISRAAAAESIRIASAALDNENVSDRTKQNAIGVLHSAAELVANIVEKANRVELASRAVRSLSIQEIDVVLRQVVVIVGDELEALEGGREVALRVEERVREEIRFPLDAKVGTPADDDLAVTKPVRIIVDGA